MKLPRTHKILLVIAALLFALAVVIGLSACSKRDEAAIKTGAAVVGTFFGMPPAVGESIAAALLIATHYASMKFGHSRGRRSAKKAPTP